MRSVITPDMPAITNQWIAGTLERVADLLEAQHASPYRVVAYRRAAGTIRESDRDLAVLVQQQGRRALEQIPTIGPSIASAVEELVDTGRLRMLERLLGQVAPEDLFATLPGVGKELARRIHDALEVDTLEDLEVAAHAGKLEQIPGIGPRRATLIRNGLEAHLRRSSHRRSTAPGDRPPVATLLVVDDAYRRLARAGRLRVIAPRRFNPTHRAWLPIYHSERDGWSFTAMFSNTAQAHRLGKTDDWVVVYYERAGRSGQVTVVTEYRGRLAGRRVVRGREMETPSGGGAGDIVRPFFPAGAARTGTE